MPFILGWFAIPTAAQIAVKNQGFVPFADEPISYRSDNLSDPVAKLQKQIDRGEVKLSYEPQHGYLRSVLETLGVPISSQTSRSTRCRARSFRSSTNRRPNIRCSNEPSSTARSATSRPEAARTTGPGRRSQSTGAALFFEEKRLESA
jgi:hypothetical protein